MRVSVRRFQRHAWKYLDCLPLVLTRYNKPVAKVTVMFTEKTNGIKKHKNTPKTQNKS